MDTTTTFSWTDMKSIGIVGQGYVGTAIKVGFEPHYDIEVYDKLEERSTCDLTELVETCKVIFVCVPTPMKKDGSCDTSIVESVIKDIDRSKRKIDWYKYSFN